MPWSFWEPELGDNTQTISMIKNATALRRGNGKPYLVYGKMQSPSQINDIETIHWKCGDYYNEAPAIFHSAWTSQEGKFAIVLANWTDSSRKVTVSDSRLGYTKVVTVPPLDCIILEQKD